VTIIKLVSKDTVDEDIYAMQQRKSKMNAAIMGSDAEWNKQTKEDKKQMLETAVSRFLKSPSTNNNPSQPAVAEAASLHKENSQNKFDFDCEEGTGEYL
jgi:diacylglycerol kinase family enzyme